MPMASCSGVPTRAMPPKAQSARPPRRSGVSREHARERLAALSARTELGQALRAWIAAQLHAHLPTRAQAARGLGLTERTLARRLQAQGLSFSGLLDEARRAAALQALAHTQRPLAEIGQALDYAEPSVFNRAVRRWTGSTPGAWRLAQQVTDDEVGSPAAQGGSSAV